MTEFETKVVNLLEKMHKQMCEMQDDLEGIKTQTGVASEKLSMIETNTAGVADKLEEKMGEYMPF